MGLSSLFLRRGNKQQIQALALRAEDLARALNKLPADDTPQDIVGILQTVCALLQRLTEQQARLLAEAGPVASPTQPPSAAVAETAETTQLAQAAPAAEQPNATTGSTLSDTAKELIKLSDWILLAKAGEKAVQPVVLEEIYRRLTALLAGEGVTALDASGPCDYERQMVVGTQVTDDPALYDHIYSTVRPGYLFHQQLLRPQEVIVYTGEDS
jgi:hypothetical protein